MLIAASINPEQFDEAAVLRRTPNRTGLLISQKKCFYNPKRYGLQFSPMICQTNTQLHSDNSAAKLVASPDLKQNKKQPDETAVLAGGGKKLTRVQYKKLYYQRNRERLKADATVRRAAMNGPEYWRKYYQEHRETRLAASKLWSKRHRDKQRPVKAAWVHRNRAKVRDRHKHYMLRRRREDVLFSLRCRLSDRVIKALKRLGVPRSNHTMNLVGCSLAKLKSHIESKFKDGMTWELFMAGKIHLDHVKPLAAFDLRIAEQQKAALNFMNLSPEWPAVNLRKHSHWQGKHRRYADHGPTSSQQALPSLPLLDRSA